MSVRADKDVLIVGAGLAGLNCARRLAEGGVASRIFEASDEVGGRVRTDQLEGFLLDRGFQVFLTAYPEARRALDYERLSLRPFYSGALIRAGGEFVKFADPVRHPLDGLLTLFSSAAGTVGDKLRLGRLRLSTGEGAWEKLFRRPETTTLAALGAAGFSESLVEQFFRPFFGGVFLERELRTSSRMFEFTFRMFSSGVAALPAAGMGEIPRQLAARLAPGSVHLNAPVASVEAGAVTLASGERVAADAVVVAAGEYAAARLLGLTPTAAAAPSRTAACMYFAAGESPVAEPILVLNGEGAAEAGPVNNLCVPSMVAPAYAPPGASLISVSVVGERASAVDAELEGAVREQLAGWFGAAVIRGWRHLRTYRIPRALPEQSHAALADASRVRLRPGLYACGDYLDSASINGALRAGRLAAEAAIEDLTSAAATRVAAAAA